MQEDVAATIRVVGHRMEICGLCGTPYPVDHLAAAEADPGDGTRSAFEYVCPECRLALAQGDDPAFPLDANDDARAST